MAGMENNILYGGGFKLEISSPADILNMQRNSTDVSNLNGTGSPEGVVSANPSSFYHDHTGGNVYKKASGTGNTGWVNLADAPPKVWFASNASTQVDNVVGLTGNLYTVLFPNNVQSGTDYDPLTGVFTCSSANKYQINSGVGFLGLDNTNTDVNVSFVYFNVGSGVTQKFRFANLPALSITDSNTAGMVNGSIMLPFSVGDTMRIEAEVKGVSNNVGILGQYNIVPELYTYFSIFSI